MTTAQRRGLAPLRRPTNSMLAMLIMSPETLLCWPALTEAGSVVVVGSSGREISTTSSAHTQNLKNSCAA